VANWSRGGRSFQNEERGDPSICGGAFGWSEVATLRAGLRSAPLRYAGQRSGLAWDEVSGRLVAMSIDSELQKHYGQLLGIGSPWEVKTVELKLEQKQVEIELGWQWGAEARCPECGVACSLHDCAPERTWRHLDTMQFTTLIRARTPRSNCPEHGVKTMKVPWAAPQGRFTLLFERFAVEVLTYLKHRITNAVTEGLNSKIQSLKSAARGFRNFRNYRIRILFFCESSNSTHYDPRRTKNDGTRMVSSWFSRSSQGD